jgi:hypothetical protein
MVFGGNQINNNINNYIPIPSNSFMGTLLFMLLTMFIVGILIAGVVHLINFAQHCLNSQGQGSQGSQGQGYYEPFASPVAAEAVEAVEAYKKELTGRLKQIKQLNQVLDDSIDTFNDNIQDTCEVYAQVEDIYVGNNSGPTSEDEYNLPKDELDRRLARRKKSAQKRFQEARSIYGTTINTPVYECFENPGPQSIPDLEDDMRAELEDLETKIQSVEVGTVGQKSDSMNALLKFNNKYIKKSLQEMGNEKARVLEGFGGLLPPSENPPLQTVSGAALLKRADAAINKANAIYAGITTQQTTVNQQKELVKEITNTTSRVESGNVTAGDMQA